MTGAIRMTAVERRARLVRGHALGRTAGSVLEAVRGVAAQHSSDPATPYLSMWARVRGFTTADLDLALCEARSLWRLHAMRRTLFIVPADEAAVFEAGAARDVAHLERQRVVKWLAAERSKDETERLMQEAERSVQALLSDGVERRTQELTAEIPALATEITLGSGKWSTRSPLSSRLLYLMAMDGAIVRTRTAGSWRASQYHWARADAWFGSTGERLEPAEGRVELARRYLETHGPATLTDVRWWTGWTARKARAAVDRLDTVPVRLESGDEGILLAKDADAVAAGPMTVALLPALDSTPMGWKDRDWYLGSNAGRLYDTNGNIGPSVWVDGRVVGGWAQRPDGEVVVHLLEDVGAEAARHVLEEAAALTRWMDGTAVIPRFRTPLERTLTAGEPV